MAESETFRIQWRGTKKGPWDLAAIKSALKAGDVHSMYQIEAGGQWQPLRDFLEVRQAKERTGRTAADVPAKHEQHEASSGSGRSVPPEMHTVNLELRPALWPPLYYDRPLKRSHNSMLRSPVFTRQTRQKLVEPTSKSDEAEPDSAVKTEHMEWKHVGMAMLFLLGIAAAGFGSYYCVQALRPSAHGSKTTPNSYP
jgi:hypothetical protein